jgi:phosphatidate cytidylyltransferase
VVVGAGTLEYYWMQEEKGLQPWAWFGVSASLAWCGWVYRFGSVGLPYPLAGLLLFLLVMALRRRRTGFGLEDAGATLMGVLYVGFLGSFALLVRNFSGAERFEGGATAVLVLVGIWATDIGAYFSGRFFGRRRPFPHISPSKTEAGFAGGLVGALGTILIGSLALGLMSFQEGLGLGLVVGVGALVGDLVESMVKRDAGVKDASRTIPGHGGVLDRFDSFLFVYPLVFFYLSLLRGW